MKKEDLLTTLQEIKQDYHDLEEERDECFKDYDEAQGKISILIQAIKIILESE